MIGQTFLGMPVVAVDSMQSPKDLMFMSWKDFEKGKTLAAIKGLPLDDRMELYETGVLLGKFTADDCRANESLPPCEGSQ